MSANNSTNLSSKNSPIGVFDSGLGGLTVVKELIKQLPFESIVYFGDTARVPYGTKSKESIVRFSKENVACLLRHKVKMIVVACNTSSSLALPVLKKLFSVPIIGVIEPGAKKAVAATRNKRIGVIATSATINSQAYAHRIKYLDRSIKIKGQACPLFVPLVEEGWFDEDVTFNIARKYLKDMRQFKIDTLILGCTHYPLLKNVLRRATNHQVCLIDSAKEVALEVKGLLKCSGLECARRKQPRHLFLVSDEPKHFQNLARRFLGYNIKNIQRCNVV